MIAAITTLGQPVPNTPAAASMTATLPMASLREQIQTERTFLRELCWQISSRIDCYTTSPAKRYSSKLSLMAIGSNRSMKSFVKSVLRKLKQANKVLFSILVLLTTVGLIAAPAGGEGTIPRLAFTYEGTIYNTTFNDRTTLDQRFLGRYIGTTKAEGQGSRMAIDIEKSDRKEYIQLKMTIWQGFDVAGNLIGKISPDGQLGATGVFYESGKYVFRESRAWDCNLTGRIEEYTFNGTYSCFPRTITGRNCPQLPGYPCSSTEAMQGSFNLEKFRPLIQPE